MYKVLITEAAEKDIQESVDYISLVLDNHAAAGHFLDSLEMQIEVLSNNPKIYQIATDDYFRINRIRCFLIENYLGFYRVDDDNQKVTIFRVLYARRDWMELFDAGESI